MFTFKNIVEMLPHLMVFRPDEETMEIFLMHVKKVLIEKLKGKTENNGRKHISSETVPLTEKLKLRNTWAALSWWISPMRNDYGGLFLFGWQ